MAKNPRNNSKPLPGSNGHWAPCKDILKSPGTVGNYQSVTPAEIWTRPRNRSWNFRYPCPWTILISGPVDFCLIKLNRSKNSRSGSTHQVQRDPNLGPWLVLVYVLNLRAGRGLSIGLVTKWSVDSWFEVLFEGQNCRLNGARWFLVHILGDYTIGIWLAECLFLFQLYQIIIS